MFIHHLYKTPIKKKTHTISYQSSQSPQINHEQSKFKQRIHQLYQNFNSLSSTIDVDITKNHFNLIEYERQDEKIKYDPQMMSAKLRRLQNQAQINKIQMQLQQRRKKKTKSQFKHLKYNNNQFQNISYQQTYKSFLKNNKLIQMPQNDSQSQQDISQQKPKGIARFHQLKKHNKILQFTINKIKNKQLQSIHLENQFQSRKLNVKNITNELKDYGQFADMIRKKSTSTPSVVNQVNPQTIIQDKYKRIMTMKAKDKVSDQVKMNARCNKIMDVQNDILLQLQQEKKNLSKQNMKKLKSRFIQIVNELNKGDKKRKQNKFLPSIQTAAFTANNTARTSVSRRVNNNNSEVNKGNIINMSNTLQNNTFDMKRYSQRKSDTIDNHLTIETKFGQGSISDEINQ